MLTYMTIIDLSAKTTWFRGFSQQNIDIEIVFINESAYHLINSIKMNLIHFKFIQKKINSY